MKHSDSNSMVKDENINPHYYRGDLVMRIIEHFNLGFRVGNCVKYLLRYPNKGGIEDLKKAKWYLDREIQYLEFGKKEKKA